MPKTGFLRVPLLAALAGSMTLAAVGGAGVALARPSGDDPSIERFLMGDRGDHGHHGHHRGHGGQLALVSIAVTPATPTIAAGTDQQFIATGTYSDASTADISASATWASSDPSATIGVAGLAHGVSAGSSTISATSGPVSGSTVLTVTAAPAAADVTVLGIVQAIFANGDFRLTVGPTTYTVVMSPGTSIVNLLGHIVPSQFIAVGGGVEVTGPLSGTTIQAQLVVVQNTIDF